MERLKEKAADLVEHVEDIADTFYKLALVNATQKATNLASSFLVVLALSVFGILCFLFGGIALSLWLGNVIGSRAGGFLIVAGIYIVLLLVVILLRKKIIFPVIRDMLIRKVYD
jgi:putative superfamily III holin-X